MHLAFKFNIINQVAQEQRNIEYKKQEIKKKLEQKNLEINKLKDNNNV
jgi:hypothetical protein